MTIEQRLVARFGVTDDMGVAVWMLRDGTMVNGSYEGFQRDVDHAEIRQFYKVPKEDWYGNAIKYIRKFIRRGNIRMGCSGNDVSFQFAVPPTDEQLLRLVPACHAARRGHGDVMVARNVKAHETNWMDYREFTDYLSRNLYARPAIRALARIYPDELLLPGHGTY